MRTALVALAGGLGAVVRYRIGLAVGLRSFPWGTAAINVSGCFVLAFVLFGPLAARWPTAITAAVTVGFLGAYTTFSTFGYETFSLLRAERPGAASAYVALSLVGGIGATALGYVLGRAAA